MYSPCIQINKRPVISFTCTTPARCHSCGRRSEAPLPRLWCQDGPGETPAEPGSLLSSPRWWSPAAASCSRSRWRSWTWRWAPGLFGAPRASRPSLRLCQSPARYWAGLWTQRSWWTAPHSHSLYPPRAAVWPAVWTPGPSCCSLSSCPPQNQSPCPGNSPRPNLAWWNSSPRMSTACIPRLKTWCWAVLVSSSRGWTRRHTGCGKSGYIP